jgi:hypothetical protein
VESLNAKERESFLDKETIEKLENELLSEREKNIELKSIESLFDQRTQELKNSLGSNNVLERELQSEKSRVEILLTNIDGVNNKNNKLEQVFVINLL